MLSPHGKRPRELGVLQCATVCCSVLQCFAEIVVRIRCSFMHQHSNHHRVLQCVALCCSVLQCVAVCCRGRGAKHMCFHEVTLESSSASCCSVLLYVTMCCRCRSANHKCFHAVALESSQYRILHILPIYNSLCYTRNLTFLIWWISGV